MSHQLGSWEMLIVFYGERGDNESELSNHEQLSGKEEKMIIITAPGFFWGILGMIAHKKGYWIYQVTEHFKPTHTKNKLWAQRILALKNFSVFREGFWFFKNYGNWWLDAWGVTKKDKSSPACILMAQWFLCSTILLACLLARYPLTTASKHTQSQLDLQT